MKNLNDGRKKMKKYRVSFRVQSRETLSYDIESKGKEDKDFLEKVAIDRFYADVEPNLRKSREDDLDQVTIEEIEDGDAPWLCFDTHNDTDLDSSGTHLQGVVRVSYQDLRQIFGQDTCYDDYKSDAEWVVKFGDGQIATIYNYKDGRNYLGDDGMPKENIIDWHVGGNSKDVYYRIEEIITDKGVWDETEVK